MKHVAIQIFTEPIFTNAIDYQGAGFVEGMDETLNVYSRL